MNFPHRQFGTLIADRRLELGLRMQDVADRLASSKGNISAYESGQYLPKANKMYALAKVLDLPYEDLLAVAGLTHPDSLPALAPYLRAKYRDLPDDALREADAFFAELQQRYGTGGDDVESDH
jgi:transcriptional regulator with XRE-family HTH domain